MFRRQIQDSSKKFEGVKRPSSALNLLNRISLNPDSIYDTGLNKTEFDEKSEEN